MSKKSIYDIIKSYKKVDDVRDEDFTEADLVDRSKIEEDMTHDLDVSEARGGGFIVSGGTGWSKSGISAGPFSDLDRATSVRDMLLSELNDPSEMKVRVENRVQERIRESLELIRKGVAEREIVTKLITEGARDVDLKDGDTILVKHKISYRDFVWFRVTVVEDDLHIDDECNPMDAKGVAVDWAKENCEGRILVIQDGEASFIRKGAKSSRQYAEKWRVYLGERAQWGGIKKSTRQMVFFDDVGELTIDSGWATRNFMPADFDTLEEAEKAIRDTPRERFGNWHVLMPDTVKIPVKKGEEK